MKLDKSCTDLALWLLINCGTKEIVEIKAAKMLMTVINILSLRWYDPDQVLGRGRTIAVQFLFPARPLGYFLSQK